MEGRVWGLQCDSRPHVNNLQIKICSILQGAKKNSYLTKESKQSQKKIKFFLALHLNELSGGFDDCHHISKGLSMRPKEFTRTAFLSMLTILFSLSFPLAFCNCSYLWSTVV